MCRRWGTHWRRLVALHVSGGVVSIGSCPFSRVVLPQTASPMRRIMTFFWCIPFKGTPLPTKWSMCFLDWYLMLCMDSPTPTYSLYLLASIKPQSSQTKAFMVFLTWTLDVLYQATYVLSQFVPLMTIFVFQFIFLISQVRTSPVRINLFQCEGIKKYKSAITK